MLINTAMSCPECVKWRCFHGSLTRFGCVPPSVSYYCVSWAHKGPIFDYRPLHWQVNGRVTLTDTVLSHQAPVCYGCIVVSLGSESLNLSLWLLLTSDTKYLTSCRNLSCIVHTGSFNFIQVFQFKHILGYTLEHPLSYYHGFLHIILISIATKHKGI